MDVHSSSFHVKKNSKNIFQKGAQGGIPKLIDWVIDLVFWVSVYLATTSISCEFMACGYGIWFLMSRTFCYSYRTHMFLF
jgi:hypothetical protein